MFLKYRSNMNISTQIECLKMSKILRDEPNPLHGKIYNNIVISMMIVMVMMTKVGIVFDAMS